MITFQSFLSGSSGNCTLISNGRTHVLIDCGATGRYITQCLGRVGINPHDLSGILVTHEHRDHSCGVGVMARKYGLKIYTNGPTLAGMRPIIGSVDEDSVVLVEPEQSFAVGDLDVQVFSVPHDAACPVGYSLTDGHETFSIATDMGYVADSVVEHLKGSDGVIVESNHDVDMLKNGRYPWPLKKRILSDHGHLSNDRCGELCSALVKSGVKALWLGHLSLENNRPDVAYETVRNTMCCHGIRVGNDVALGVLPRYWIAV